MPIKTYSRQRAAQSRTGEPPAKRQRVSRAADSDTSNIDTTEAQEDALPTTSSSTPALPSSTPPPTHPAVSSDPPAPVSTPPSSPPPTATLSPATLPPRRTTFSFLKRKHTSARLANPLTETTPNAQKTPGPSQKKRRRLTQMRIDLGGEVRKTCKTCGMEYIPSHIEDAALHKKFHAQNVGGVDVPKSFVDSISNECQVWKDPSGKSCVVAVGRNQAVSARNVVRRVLEVVNAELAAVEIREEELWGRVSVHEGLEGLGDGGGGADAAVRRVFERQSGDGVADRFKAYLYIQGSKCIALCLAERISAAYRVLGDGEEGGVKQSATAGASSSSIAMSRDSDPAILGISRIWTSGSHRKKGIAKTLLDRTASTFLYGLKVPVDMIAFSQPTESGGRLARSWFGMESGWHVYTD